MAGDIYLFIIIIFFILLFIKKVDISSELSAEETMHMKCLALFF